MVAAHCGPQVTGSVFLAARRPSGIPRSATVATIPRTEGVFPTSTVSCDCLKSKLFGLPPRGNQPPGGLGSTYSYSA